VNAAAQSIPAQAKGQSVYFEVNRAPYGASESSFIGETLQRLGARNILPAALGPFPQINPEFVVRAQPDIIMVGDSSSADMATRPGWQNMRAMRTQRVCHFKSEESDVLVRAGPRMAEAARLMAKCLTEKAQANKVDAVYKAKGAP
jgi:iron complex transport system substrate-binding protein